MRSRLDYFIRTVDGTMRVTGSSDVADGKWYQVTVTRVGTEVRMRLRKRQEKMEKHGSNTPGWKEVSKTTGIDSSFSQKAKINSRVFIGRCRRLFCIN